MNLSSSFKSGKCKTSLKLVISRIKLLKNRREALVSQMRGEVVQLLLANQDQNARIRVEHVIREEKVRSAYDIIEVYCELLATRLQVLDFQKSCPIDLKEAVASLTFAAPRCADIPELMDVRKHLASKYGKEFEKAALEVRPDSGVSPLIVEKLSAGAPDIETKVKVLRSIAKENGVKWEPKSFGETLERPRQANQRNMPISLESPRAPVMETANPELRSNQKLDLDRKNKSTKWSWAARSSSGSANKTSAAEYDSQPQPTIREQRPRGYGSSQSQENRRMEFTDAAMAAKVAAESAEKACMAAKAAAELASRGQRRRESRGEYVLDSSYVTDYSYSLNSESENSHGSAKIRTERSMPASFGVEDSESEYAFSQRSLSERRASRSKLQKDMFMNNNNSENGREKEFAMSYASERSVPASYDMDESKREYVFSERRSSERQATRSRLQKNEVVNNNHFEKQREKVYPMRYASERENFRPDNETTYDGKVMGGRNQEHENYTSNNFTNNGREQDEWDLHEGTFEKVDGDGFCRSSGAFSAGYDRQEVSSLSREKESALSDLSLQHRPRRSKQQVKEYSPKDVSGLSNHLFPRTKGREVQGLNRKPAVPRYDSDSNSSEGDQTEASVRTSAPKSVAEPADYSSSESSSVLNLGKLSGGLRNKHYDQSWKETTNYQNPKRKPQISESKIPISSSESDNSEAENMYYLPKEKSSVVRKVGSSSGRKDKPMMKNSYKATSTSDSADEEIPNPESYFHEKESSRRGSRSHIDTDSDDTEKHFELSPSDAKKDDQDKGYKSRRTRVSRLKYNTHKESEAPKLHAFTDTYGQKETETWSSSPIESSQSSSSSLRNFRKERLVAKQIGSPDGKQRSWGEDISDEKVTKLLQSHSGRPLSINSNDSATLPAKLRYNSHDKLEAPHLHVSSNTFRRKETEKQSSYSIETPCDLGNRPHNSPIQRFVAKPIGSSDRKPSSMDDNTSHIKDTILSQDDLGRNLSVKSNDTMTLLSPSKLEYNSRKEFEAPNLHISPDTYRRKEAKERSSSPPVSSPILKNRPWNFPPERPVVKPTESSDRKPSSREEDKPQKKYMQISESNIGRNLSVESNETTALPAHIHRKLPDSDKLFAHFRALRANTRGK